MRLSDNCNLLRASGGVRVRWEQTNRGGCDQESLRVLVSCFERFLPLRCTSLAPWIQICLHLPMLLLAIVIGGPGTITSRRAECLIDRLHPERAVKRAISNRFAHVLRRDLGLDIEIGDGARNFQNPIISVGA